MYEKAKLTCTPDYDAQLREWDHSLDRRIAATLGERLNRWQRNYESIDAYQESVAPRRQEIAELLGHWPEGDPTHDDRDVDGPAADGSALRGPAADGPVGLKHREMDRYEDGTLYHIHLPLAAGLSLRGLLMTPPGIDPATAGSSPTILCLHGFYSLPESVLGLTGERDYLRAFGRRLVQAGYTVYAPLLFNDSVDRRQLNRKALLLGMNLHGLSVWSMCRLMNALMGMGSSQAGDEQGTGQPARIGMYGVSNGGMVALWTAALDKRVKATVVSGYFSDRVHQLVRPSGRRKALINRADEDEFFFPNLLRIATDMDVASLICPRPLMIEAGRADPLIDIHDVQREFGYLQEIYQRLGIAQRVKLDAFNGDHFTRCDGALAFLQAMLPAAPAVAERV